MVAADRKLDDGQLLYLDSFQIERRRIAMGLSRKKLTGRLILSMNTLKAIYKGDGVLPDTARRLAKQLNCQIIDLLSPRDSRYVAPATEPGPASGASEWEMDGYLDQGRLASNGLYYIACRMKHRYTTNRSGRGKFYHLSLMNPQMRHTIQDKLSRHAEVCTRVGLHPHVAHNLTSTPAVGDAGWWVIDDWIGEQTLADRLESGAWPAAELPRLLLDVANGLQALHTAGVVFRELAPARVLISDQDGRAVLTDFELAKLLDGSPSVSSEWPEDPYRAPEVDGGSATVQADLYSFGKTAVAAAAGELIEHDAIPDLFSEVGIPKRLVKLLVDCTEPVPAKRPAELGPLLKELTVWQKKSS
jgi:serine/threonine protein kinase